MSDLQDRPMRFHSPPVRRRRDRRGSAVVLVLLLTVTLAAIAASAIVLMRSSLLIGNYYDRENEFRYAAESGLALGKAQLDKDTTLVLPDSGYLTLISGGTITGADGLTVPNVSINVYA